MLHIIVKILAFAASFYFILMIAAYFLADKIAFPAPKPSYELSEKYRLIDAPNGGKICTVFLKNPNAKYTILFSHGNGEDLGEIEKKLENLYNLGFSVFAYDYFGYGQSTLKSSAKNIEICAETAWQHLVKTENVPEDKIIVFGYSMGSAPSSYIASKHKPRALILMGGFASAFQTQLPINIFPWDMLNNAKKIANLPCPVLIFHGTKDCIVRYHNAEILYEKASCPKYLISIKGAGHYDIPYSAPKAFFGGIKNFANTLDPNVENAINASIKSKQ